MKTRVLAWLVAVGLALPAGGQEKAPAPPKTSPAAAASEDQKPAKPRPKLRFRTTRAQARAQRVRAARKRRLEDIRKLFATAQLDYPPAQVLMRVFKNEDLVELWARRRRQRIYVHLKDYDVCQRSGDLGPKRRRGDMQVPEGFYTITAYNPTSSFLLAMLVSYPNRSDRIRKSGRDPGGDICIHGDCVTIGCIPLTDRWIEELYLICLDTSRRSGNPTLVHSFPGRLGGEAWEKLKKKHADEPGLIRFWEELKVGYDRLEKTRIPARFTIGRNGAYRFR